MRHAWRPPLTPASSSATQNAQNRNDNREGEIARPTNQNSANAHGRRDSESKTNIILVGDLLVKTFILESYQENVLASLHFQAKEQRKLPMKLKI